MDSAAAMSVVEPKPDDRSALSAARLAAGDRDEFARLVDLNQQRIARLVSRLLGWKPDVHDVVQDVFVSALAAISKFEGRSDVNTWLTRIAINTCRRHNRRRMLSGEALRRLVRPVAIEPQRENDARSEAVRRAVQRLPSRYREVVVLRYLEERTIPQICDLLQARRNTIEVRLTRARSKLRDLLGEPGSGDDTHA